MSQPTGTPQQTTGRTGQTMGRMGQPGMGQTGQQATGQQMTGGQTTPPVQSAAQKSERQLRREYPAFWEPGTQQEPTNVPTPQELERMEQIQQRRGGYPTESQTPAYREAQSEIVEERMGDRTGQGARQPTYGQLYRERRQTTPRQRQRRQQQTDT